MLDSSHVFLRHLKTGKIRVVRGDSCPYNTQSETLNPDPQTLNSKVLEVGLLDKRNAFLQHLKDGKIRILRGDSCTSHNQSKALSPEPKNLNPVCTASHELCTVSLALILAM